MCEKILLVSLDHQSEFHRKHSLLKRLAVIWEQQGHVVELVSDDNYSGNPDIVISHIDLTVVPDCFLKFFEHFNIVINREIRNISKSSLSMNALLFDDDYDGPVIVKTADNNGGLPELTYDIDGRYPNQPLLLKRIRRSIVLRKNAYLWPRLGRWRRVKYLSSDNYPLFDSMSVVPSEVWSNERLVVEKFLPEIDCDGNYCLRYWIFLGDREIIVKHVSQRPVIKATMKTSRIISDVPEELREFRARLGIDYGRFDFAIVDGRAVIFDVNKTPTAGPEQLELIGGELQGLAQGIRAFISN